VTRSAPPALVLASGSTGRLKVLRSAGYDPEVVVSGVDETCDDTPDTATLVGILAERKAAAVASVRPQALVLGCDSMLDLDGEALGKPASAEQAIALWQRLSGREGTLYTGHCIIDGIDGSTARTAQAVAATVIRFGTPTPGEIAAYVASGEPLVVAGGFAIDGLGGSFVESIDGDPSNVIGLSLPLLRHLLAGLGIAVTDLWRDQAG
jgi:septum formation protein